MNYDELRERACTANKEISRTGLAILTWGNASEVNRDVGVFAIKPSGVDYDNLTPSDIVICSLETGEKIEGIMTPSSDAATHRHLYRAFPSIGGIVHAHSSNATAWAQAHREIPCLGTTHADTFYGSVPCTRPLTQSEVEGEYELNTGKVIGEHFLKYNLKADEMPGVLVSGHGPFTWGADAMEAVINARILEEAARMAVATLAINPDAGSIDRFLLDKHYMRKHGTAAYYGQQE